MTPVPRVDVAGIAFEVLPLAVPGVQAGRGFHLRKINGKPADAVVILQAGLHLLCSCRLKRSPAVTCPHVEAVRAAGLLGEVQVQAPAVPETSSP